MVDEANIPQIKSLIENAQHIVILYPQEASFDQKAVASSLYLILTKAQKSARLITVTVPVKEQNTLVGLADSQTELGHQNLSISFTYTPEQVDKVSYHIGEQTGKFYLTIKPKAGFPPLDAHDVEFSYTGASADLIIIVGVNNLEQLEQLYFGYEDMYRDVPSISINTYATSFGTVTLDSGSASSTSEVTAQLIPQLDLPFDTDSATNLLLGIEAATTNFTSMSANAETFETVALLLRSGARRSVKPQKNTPGISAKAPVKVPAFIEEPPLIEDGMPVLLEKDSILQETKPKQNKNNPAKKNNAAPPEGFTPSKRI